jgi:hypothetical protein
LGINSAQQRTINGGKRCQTLAKFPLVEATIGPIDVDLCARWVYGVHPLARLSECWAAAYVITNDRECTKIDIH